MIRGLYNIRGREETIKGIVDSPRGITTTLDSLFLDNPTTITCSHNTRINGHPSEALQTTGALQQTREALPLTQELGGTGGDFRTVLMLRGTGGVLRTVLVETKPITNQ